MHVRIDQSRHDDRPFAGFDQLAVGRNLIERRNRGDPSATNMYGCRADSIFGPDQSSTYDEFRRVHFQAQLAGGGGGDITLGIMSGKIRRYAAA